MKPKPYIYLTRYDSFGKIKEAEEKIRNIFKYAGEQHDPLTNQYYLRARYYNPVIGRFTQEDRYRGDGLSLYAYCDNNPINYVDPTGYAKTQCQLKEELYQRQKLRKEGKLKESNYKNGNKPEKGTRGTDKSTWKEQDRKQKQFNDRMNNPKYYQIEDPVSNRSHQHEMPK